MTEHCPICGLPHWHDPFEGAPPNDHFNCAVSVKHILWMTQNECALLNTALTRVEGISKMQQSFFNLAMDRAEKAEAQVRQLQKELFNALQAKEHHATD